MLPDKPFKTLLNIVLICFLLIPTGTTGTSLAQVWVQKGADMDGEAAGDESGVSVSMSADGNTVAIGANKNDDAGIDAGHVRVYTWSGSVWIKKGTDIEGEALGDHSGSSVSLSTDGNMLAIGAMWNDGTGNSAGHVRIYQWNGSAWIQRGADIDGEAAADHSGISVSMSSDGNTLAIGARGNDETGYMAGHARIYEWSEGAWVQKGSDIDGEAAEDQFGTSASMSSDGNTVAIGAPFNDGAASDAGHVRIYHWNGSAWIQKGTDIDGEANHNASGCSVAMSSDGNSVAIGAQWNSDAGSAAGHVRIYQWNESTWVQRGADIDGEAAADHSGFSVGMSSDGNTVAIGANLNDGSDYQAGHVRIYKWNENAWIQTGTDIDGEAAYDQSGCSVSMSLDGDALAVGAYWNGPDGTNVGHVRVFALCTPSTGTDVITACISYTWIDGVTYTSDNNTATHTLINSAGCDSLVTLDLSIKTVDVSLTDNSSTLTANANGATYQWLDCNNNHTMIAGEAYQSFTASANNDYAVEITQNGCVDTSACVAITTVGLFENTFANEIQLYPNPTKNTFNIQFENIRENVLVKVRDITGKLVLNQEFGNANSIQINIDGEQGVYIVEISSEEERAVMTIVKQ